MSGSDDPTFGDRRRDRELQAVALLRSYATTTGDAFDEERRALLGSQEDLVGAVLGMLTVARRLVGIVEILTGKSADDVLAELRRMAVDD